MNYLSVETAMSETGEGAGEWVAAIASTDVSVGEMAGVEIGDRYVAIYNVDGTFHATDNVCSHAFTLLTDGWLDGDSVECPLHGARFDVRTGAALSPPADCAIAVFETRVVEGIVKVRLPQNG